MNIKIKKIFNGIYNVVIIDNDEYIGKCIEAGHEWDRWMRREARMYHKHGTDILDIGANIGYNTLLLSDYGPVISFEPVFHQLVSNNVKINTLRNPVKVIPCALSDKESIETIYLPNSKGLINYGGTSFYGNGEGIRVKCMRLDDMYKGVPSLIKIDVEGHELQVLKGAVNTLRTHKPTVLIEIINFSDTNEVHLFMKSLGYLDPEPRPEKMYLYIKNNESRPC